MKRLACILLIVCMMFATLWSATAEDADYSQYSLSELYMMRRTISEEIAKREPEKKLIYEDDEVSIQWYGLQKKKFGYVQVGLLFQNKTDHPLYYGFENIAFNGIQMTGSNDGGQTKIEANMMFLSTTDFSHLYDLNDYAAVGLNDISDVTDVHMEIGFYPDDGWASSTYKVIPLDVTNQ